MSTVNKALNLQNGGNWVVPVRARTQNPAACLPGSAPHLHEARTAALDSLWLRGQSAAIRHGILRCSTVQKFAKDQTIVALEEMNTPLHFLLQGAVELSMPRASLELSSIHVIPGLQWFGEHSAITGRPSFAEYRARTKSLVLVVPRAALISLQSEIAEFSLAMVELLSLALKNSLELAGDLSGLKSEDRVLSKLHTMSGFANAAALQVPNRIPMSQEELAIVSCVSRSTICKVLKKLEDAGVIRVGYRWIDVLNRGALSELLRGDKTE